MARPIDHQMIGRNIAGKFLVQELLGGGAVGAVYKAYQKSIEKHVAIKVLHPELVREPSFVSRFEREAKAASLLDHVNLMRVVDYGRETDGLCYIAMELLEGRSLYQLLKEEGRLDPARIAGLLRQTLAGLAVAHDMGIIHRDLKPENIVVLSKVDDDARRVELVKVCDFGMAKMVTPEVDAGGPLSSEKLTSHGVVVGTPDYMSPEQGKGERLDARSDIYAVGVMLYQMLAQKLPFTAETPVATLLRHVIEEPIPPSEILKDVHPGLEAVCLRALAKHREDRFQTAREMRAELRTVMEARAGGLGGQARLALESIPDVFPPSDGRLLIPRPPDSRARGFGQAPNSHRIRAVDAIRDDPPRHGWGTLGVVVACAALAVGGGVAWKSRRAVARPVSTVTPAADVHAAGPSSAAAPSTTSVARPAPEDEARPAPADSHAPGRAVPPPAATLSGRSTPPRGDSVSATGVTAPVPSGQFGVLTVPELPRLATRPEPASGSTAHDRVPDPFGAATVAVIDVHAERATSADVVAALPKARFTQCYKKALVARGGAFSHEATLHLDLDPDGHVGGASFATPAELRPLAECIANAVIGADVRHVSPGTTGADVHLALRPE